MNILFKNTPKASSIATITYSGNLITSNKLYVEYSYTPLNSIEIITNKLEMTKAENAFSALIHVEKEGIIYFRFINENNQISSSEDGVGFQIPIKFFTSENNEENNEENINTTTINENEAILNPVPNALSMIPLKERNLIYARKGLRFSYKLNKRIKLLLIKLFTKLPNFITGNYRRRINL